jgi:hypothetical protein
VTVHAQLLKGPGELANVVVVRSRATANEETKCVYLMPPMTTAYLCEQYGKFDSETPTGWQAKAEQAYELITHRQGSYPDAVDGTLPPLPYLPDPLAVGVAFNTAISCKKTNRTGRRFDRWKTCSSAADGSIRCPSH